ncbi:MAG: translation initiation factor IF-2 subunit alpha [Desulfurococcales archaeon ex4484_42]|nr:MAG: translation initiation factor IF-2 subunit alpha [Desulfurococcales archaeon ex4484_42]
MVRKRKPLPTVGELVVGTITKVFDYGAYMTLDEYGDKEAYLPWSEVSSKWVRDIRDVVREGQKVVVKVIRVDKKKGHVDVSLKRVHPTEQRRKILEWKRAQRAEKILELAAKSISKTLDEAYEEVGWKLEDIYGEIYAAFEEAAYRGAEVLRKAGIPDEWIEALMEQIRKHIIVKKIKIQGIITLYTLASDGVDRIKKALMESLTMIKQSKNLALRVYSIGSPRYRVEVIGTDYKQAEKLLREYLANVEALAKKLGLNFSFEREKLRR